MNLGYRTHHGCPKCGSNIIRKLNTDDGVTKYQCRRRDKLICLHTWTVKPANLEVKKDKKVKRKVT